MSEQREMTLDEWVNRLPDFHLANKQYQQLQQRITELEAQLSQLHEQQDSKAITMLFGLMGYLTSMEEPITFSAYHNATPGADILSRLIQANELKGDCDWDSYKPPKEKDHE